MANGKSEKIEFPGLIVENLRGGRVRYRVREKGNPSNRVVIFSEPGSPEFILHYELARSGVNIAQSTPRTARKYLYNTKVVGEAAKLAVARARKRATRKNVLFQMTEEMVIELLRQQRCRCALTGMTFAFGAHEGGLRNPRAMSLDRIIPVGGYVPGNVRLITTMANVARSDWGDDEFFEMCRAAMERKS
ncbi:MAG: hypothetical protein CMJ32_10970 [Phycisphaerae bacterium]|nr:hypothetical protein [Phycisphaerae bacterium]